jgi:hypothetical protein
VEAVKVLVLICCGAGFLVGLGLWASCLLLTGLLAHPYPGGPPLSPGGHAVLVVWALLFLFGAVLLMNLALGAFVSVATRR